MRTRSSPETVLWSCSQTHFFASLGFAISRTFLVAFQQMSRQQFSLGVLLRLSAVWVATLQSRLRNLSRSWSEDSDSVLSLSTFSTKSLLSVPNNEAIFTPCQSRRLVTKEILIWMVKHYSRWSEKQKFSKIWRESKKCFHSVELRNSSRLMTTAGIKGGKHFAQKLKSTQRRQLRNFSEVDKTASAASCRLHGFIDIYKVYVLNWTVSVWLNERCHFWATAVNLSVKVPAYESCLLHHQHIQNAFQYFKIFCGVWNRMGIFGWDVLGNESNCCNCHRIFDWDAPHIVVL